LLCLVLGFSCLIYFFFHQFAIQASVPYTITSGFDN